MSRRRGADFVTMELNRGRQVLSAMANARVLLPSKGLDLLPILAFPKQGRIVLSCANGASIE